MPSQYPSLGGEGGTRGEVVGGCEGVILPYRTSPSAFEPCESPRYLAWLDRLSRPGC